MLVLATKKEELKVILIYNSVRYFIDSESDLAPIPCSVSINYGQKRPIIVIEKG
jgi:hypothetical protein